ncbi:hypothetical protein [Oleisolibacter albus]|uniref:hypothetical protein n=1 Tax=Oleisolibacter albus TaxID=2171757 RepID=UPI0012D7FA52|nr:hypothetical protein [Oleisolibacter albus]
MSDHPLQINGSNKPRKMTTFTRDKIIRIWISRPSISPVFVSRGAAFSLADQAIQGLATFTFTALLTRTLGVTEFGRFSLVWVLAFLAEGCVSALISDPMPMVHARCSRFKRPELLTSGLFISFIASSALSILIIFFGYMSCIEDIFMVMCLAIANITWRMHMQTRRNFYLHGSIGRSLPGSTAYLLLLLIGAALSAHGGHAEGAVLLWSVASTAAILVNIWLHPTPLVRPSRRLLVWMCPLLWRAGRWLVGTSVAFWIGNQGVIAYTASLVSLHDAGTLRAMQNLFMPFTQIMSALYTAMIPRVTMKIHKTRQNSARNYSAIGGILFTIAAIMYGIFLYSSTDLLIMFLYGDQSLIKSTSLLLPLFLIAATDACRQGLGFGLLATGRTQPVFWSRIAGLVVLGLGLLLLPPSAMSIAWAMALAGIAVTPGIGWAALRTRQGL